MPTNESETPKNGESKQVNDNPQTESPDVRLMSSGELTAAVAFLQLNSFSAQGALSAMVQQAKEKPEMGMVLGFRNQMEQIKALIQGTARDLMVIKAEIDLRNKPADDARRAEVMAEREAMKEH
jgi:predicted hotdog family 3-hydroxylacyl-ACP dehydratase